METGIYQITNKIIGKIYIGRCQNTFEKRWNEHRGQLNRNKHNNVQLQEDWIKFGAENFTFEILERCDVITLKYRELEIIAHYRSFGLELYNVYSMRDDIILGLSKYAHTQPYFESEIDLVDARCKSKSPLHWQFYVKSGQAEIYIHLYDESKHVNKMDSLKTLLTTRQNFIKDNDYFEITKNVSDVYLSGKWKEFTETLINEIDFIVSIFG